MSTTPSSPGSTEPAVARNFSLDVLRGIALVGLLFISIREFGGFTANEQARYITSPSHGGNYKLLSLVSFLFEGKMTALLAMVFGAGMIVFLQKKETPGSLEKPDAFIRQQVWLIIFGLFIAFIILWPDELLFPFGIVGIMLFAFWRQPAKSLFIASLLCMLVYCGKNYWRYADDKDDYKKYIAVTLVEKKFKQDSTTRASDSVRITKDTTDLKKKLAKIKLTDSLARKKDTLTEKQAGEKSTWENKVKSLAYDPAKTVSQNKAIRKGYGPLWFNLKNKSQQKESSWLYSIGLWDLSSTMFLGMALLGSGFFHRRFSGSQYVLSAILLIAVGSLLAWFRICNNELRISDYSTFISKHALPYNLFLPIEQILMASGFAALVMALLPSSLFNWIWKAMAAIGHMGLTSYLLQTFACTFIFYGYGLGFYGRYQQWELYFLLMEIVIAQIVFSVFWLRTYQTGPVEWLLKCLVHWKKFPLEKTVQITENNID